MKGGFVAKVVVFHFSENGRLPALSKEEADGITSKIAAGLKNYPGVKFNGTFVDKNGKGICDWEAPNAEVVCEIVEKVLGAPPADGAVVVTKAL